MWDYFNTPENNNPVRWGQLGPRAKHKTYFRLYSRTVEFAFRLRPLNTFIIFFMTNSLPNFHVHGKDELRLSTNFDHQSVILCHRATTLLHLEGVSFRLKIFKPTFPFGGKISYSKLNPLTRVNGRKSIAWDFNIQSLFWGQSDHTWLFIFCLKSIHRQYKTRNLMQLTNRTQLCLAFFSLLLGTSESYWPLRMFESNQTKSVAQENLYSSLITSYFHRLPQNTLQNVSWFSYFNYVSLAEASGFLANCWGRDSISCCLGDHFEIN